MFSWFNVVYECDRRTDTIAFCFIMFYIHEVKCDRINKFLFAVVVKVS